MIQKTLDLSYRKESAIWFIALLLFGFVVYFKGIDIPYYADDFLFFSDSSCSNVLDRFLGKGRRVGFYRPIEAAFLTCVQDHFGLSTIPIHIATITLHTLLCCLVFVFLLQIGFSHSQAILGSLFMLFSQANASAVLGNDTLSQVSGTFFGCLSLWSLYLSLAKDHPTGANTDRTIHFRSYFISNVAFAIALLSKESSVSFFPLLFGVLFLNFYDFRTKMEKSSLRRAFLAFLPFVVVLVAYFTTRSLIGASQATVGSGRYNLSIGMNVVENVALLFFASIVPVSTVTAFTSINSGQFGIFIAVAFVSLLFLGCVAYGLWRSRRHGTILAVGALGIGALFPMVLMNHVSELYAYNTMPFVAMGVGISLGTFVECVNTRHGKQAIVALVCILLVSHIIAVQDKASLMEKNGVRAAMLLNEIQPYAQMVSQGGELLLVNPDDNQPEYSVFLMRGFNVLRYGVSRIKRTSNRYDISVKIIEEKELDAARHNGQNPLILYLDGDFVRAMEQSVKKN